jgi:hypothetical protein
LQLSSRRAYAYPPVWLLRPYHVIRRQRWLVCKEETWLNRSTDGTNCARGEALEQQLEGKLDMGACEQALAESKAQLTYLRHC